MNLLTKIFLPVLALLVLLTTALSITAAVLGGSAMDQEFVKRGSSVATGLSSNGRMGVLLNDSTQLDPLITAAFLDRDVRSVSFLDRSDRTIAARGRRMSAPRTDTTNTATGATMTLVAAGSEERGSFTAPITLAGGGSVGRVVVEISRSALNDLRRTTLRWTIGLGLVFVALSMLLLPVLKSLLGPLRDLATVSDSVATGNLTVEISLGSGDEVGRLARSFATMVSNLRSAIGEVQQASAAVDRASVSISHGAEGMAAGAQVQTQRVGDIVRIIGQMSTSIVENSHHARSTADAAGRARELATNGDRVVNESIEAMRRMADVVRRSSETVRALGRSSDRIGTVVSVIDDIADQTNLLALNAAIEAARAGDQGRGFAVVADEVRKLAERTTQATEEIAGMIGQIQKETGEAVGAMEKGTAEVDRGIVHADGAGTALRSILDTTQQVTDMIGRMASASEEQAAASEEIARSVEGIDRVTREGADALRQIARTSEDLNGLTGKLQSLVGRFSIGGSDTAEEARGSDSDARTRPRYRVEPADDRTIRPRSRSIVERAPAQHAQ